MKTKFFTLAALLSIACAPAFAQITTGETSAKTIQTGNRAQAGNFGLYLGATTDIVKDIFDASTTVEALPLINLKYMNDDEIEYRIGIKAYKKGSKNSGTELDTKNDFKNKSVSSEYFLYPGIAYHFNKSNILDVYVGGELPFGINREKNLRDYDGDEYSEKFSSFQIGLGGFIGLQAYIGNLPLALGVEYGLSSMFSLGNKWKVNDDDDTYYVTDPYYYSATKFKEYKASDSFIGSEVRFTLTYFFNN